MGKNYEAQRPDVQIKILSSCNIIVRVRQLRFELVKAQPTPIAFRVDDNVDYIRINAQKRVWYFQAFDTNMLTFICRRLINDRS